MRIAFFGTGEFSKSILEDLVKNYKEIEVSLVVSQIDKPTGRKQELLPTPIKEFALNNNLNVLQPEKLKENFELFDKLKSLSLDFIVVVAYGKIIPIEILEIPKYGCINIHGSILPNYRGASPIQESLKNGDKKTGLTIMYMSKGMDEGDILKIEEIEINILDKTPDIFAKFEQIGAKILVESLEKIISGKLKGISQDNSKATYCKKIEKEDGKIDFENENVEQIYNKFRAYFPWPGIWSFYKGKKLDITNCFFEENNIIFDEDFKLGDVVEFENEGKKEIGILCKGGILILYKVKLEGKKEMSIKDFLNGNKDFLEYNFILG
ncbi:MAG: methionyl-tRNA formyltransferase [Candidatus Gracilibacteria bacterium]|nr:methionyl-tRNA formyltransferase [Candidatus Gracilibacteria bacterium]